MMSELVNIENIKKIRDLTGVGLTDAKKALTTCQTFEEALAMMQARGLTKASRRETRDTQAGLIQSYVHDGRIGVLVEVNCETGFVAKTEDFVTFVKDLCLQVAASKPAYLKLEDIPSDVLDEQRNMLEEQAKLENIQTDRLPMVIEGRLKKMTAEKCLLSQSFNKDPQMTINDLLQSKIATFGENIVIARFVRFEIGKADVELMV